MHKQVNYSRRDYQWRKHHERYKKRVQEKHPHLHCMECGGRGGGIEIVDPELGGPWWPCEYCEGTGLMTPYLRGVWLRMKRDELRKAQQK